MVTDVCLTDPPTQHQPTPPQRKRRNPKRQPHLPNNQRLSIPRNLEMFPPHPQTTNHPKPRHQRTPPTRTNPMHTPSKQLPLRPPQCPQRPNLHLQITPPLHRPKLRLGSRMARRRTPRTPDSPLPLQHDKSRPNHTHEQ